MFKRYRRLRLNESLRDMVRENNISINDFIYPLFVVEGQGIKNEISSMPGVFQMSLDEILKECQEIINLGIKSIILFGIPNLKDSIGSDALDENGIIARSLRAIKEKFPTLFVITDLCFCEYTDHGHCGILDHVCKSVDNDATLEISAKQALIHAKAGADMIAPSGMMDGIIYTLRKALDENGYEVDYSVSGTKVTVTAKASGSATITVKVAAGTNHTAPSNKTVSVTVSNPPLVFVRSIGIVSSFKAS